jgi:SulP family sulfate permease
VVDYSSLEAINMLTERYKKAGKKLYFKHLSDSCQDLITAADELVNVNVISTVKNEISVAEIVAKY